MGNLMRLELHVMAEKEVYARHKMSWTPALAEQFQYMGGGVWYSVGTYQTQYEQDKRSIEQLKEYTENCMKDFGITEYYIEIEEFDGWID